VCADADANSGADVTVAAASTICSETGSECEGVVERPAIKGSGTPASSPDSRDWERDCEPDRERERDRAAAQAGSGV
jgi:hypothetical protein